MPIQSWRLTPREAVNSSLFTIEAASFEMSIEIRVNKLYFYLLTDEYKNRNITYRHVFKLLIII